MKINYIKYLKYINNHKIVSIIGISIFLFIYFPIITFIIGISIYLLIYTFKINFMNKANEQPVNLSMNEIEFIEYINYANIKSIIGNHNKNSYFYLLLIENAYDSNTDEYVKCIKMGYTNNDPEKELYNIYRDFFHIGEVKILILIKTEKAQSIEKQIKKELNTRLKEIINIYSLSSEADEDKYIESYPYDYLYIIKCVLNFTLLEYKNSIYSYYFDKESELLYADIKYIIDNELAHEYEMNIEY